MGDCRSIKYLSVRNEGIDEDMMETLQFSLNAVNFFYTQNQDEIEYGTLEADLLCLLKYQPSLKVLSVSFFNMILLSLPSHKRACDICKTSVVDYFKKTNRNLDLFIFGDELVVINRNLGAGLIRIMDGLDYSNGWSWRSKSDKTVVSLDPSRATFTSPLE